MTEKRRQTFPHLDVELSGERGGELWVANPEVVRGPRGEATQTANLEWSGCGQEATDGVRPQTAVPRGVPRTLIPRSCGSASRLPNQICASGFNLGMLQCHRLKELWRGRPGL